MDPATPGTCANGAAATYVYDAEGRRVKAGGYEHLYDLEGRSITLLDAGTGAWDYGEIYAGARHLASYSNGTTVFNHSDWLGTERMRTSPTGTVAESCVSLPFGDALSCTGTDYSLRHFTGKEHDNESNLEYFGARFDSSTMGRFMSPDWSNPPMPIPYADLRNPQSLNLYSYEMNNPVVQADADGHCCDEAQKLERVATSLGQQMKSAASAVIKDYVHALNSSGKALTGNHDFNIGNITQSDIHNLGMQAALMIATDGASEEFNLARAAESFFGSKTFAEAGSAFGGEFANGGSALVNFAKTGDSLTVGVGIAASPDGVTGTLAAIQRGAISAAEDSGASSVTIVAKDVTNQQLEGVLEKKGFTQEFKNGQATGNWSKTIKLKTKEPI